jgi:hypothetical protein
MEDPEADEDNYMLKERMLIGFNWLSIVTIGGLQ